MARSDDDREEAPGWYARWRIEQETQLGEMHMRDFSLRLGGGNADRGKVALSNAPRARGMGYVTLIRLASALGLKSPGELFNSALAWWEAGGRDYRDRKMKEDATARRRPGSGSRPSVKVPKTGDGR